MGELTVARTRDELVRLVPGDDFLRYAVPAVLPVPAYVCGGAAGVRHPATRGGTALTLLGSPRAIDRWLDATAAVVDLTRLHYVSVAAAALSVVAPRLDLTRGGDWEWMSIHTTPPPLEQEQLLVGLGPGDLGEVKALLAVENSRTDARPGERYNERWVGARDASGALVACGVREDGPGGYPELAGITVRSDQRGRGLGAAVTARLTREAITGVGVCTLGMYADNAVARRVYHRLGYATVHQLSTRVPLRGSPVGR